MRTVVWNPEGPSVRMIDQRLLPGELKHLDLKTSGQVAEAIKDMAIRGAPAIGAAAAFGLALAAFTIDEERVDRFWQELQDAADDLEAARPTASNLAWALRRCLAAAHHELESGAEAVRHSLLSEAQQIADEDVALNRLLGQHGAALLPQQATVLHHCNTGALATVDHGTALGVIRSAHEMGKEPHVLVDETRPRLQGARLTAWELEQLDIPYEIIADGAAGYFLRRGEVAAVLVGADRVAANGDVANKIGTYMLALAAADNDVPFYVAVPTSTIDLEAPSGTAIPIEERDAAEVLALTVEGAPVAPAESKARNPAFDITPHRLVTAFITEVGVLRPPYREKLAAAVRTAR